LNNKEMPEFSYAARRGRGAVDPAMRRMALGAGGVSVLVIGVALLWSGDTPGVGFGPPPVITAPPGPLRVKPANPGGLTVPEANQQIMSGDAAAANAVPQLGNDGPAPAIAQLSQAAGLPLPAAPVVPPATPAGAVAVQLASVPGEADAENVWTALLKAAPAAVGNRQPDILPAVVNGASVWLLRVGGFTDAAAAQKFCAAIAKQAASCSVAGN